MNIHKKFIARKHYSRLDHFIKEHLESMSRSQIEKLVKEDHVKVNGKPAKRKSHELHENDTVEIEIPQTEKKEYKPTFELKRLFEDPYMLIIDKPAGISVHPGAGEDADTVLDVFRYHYPQVAEIDDTDRPGIVHRLDKDTSGVMLLAKDIRSMKRLQKQFKRRDVHKTYLALASGNLRFRSGTVSSSIVRSPRHRTKYIAVDKGHSLYEQAREAVTDYKVLYEFEDFSFLRLKPHTGRTHQLRVHLTHLGHPILGDRIYGRNTQFVRMALHAYQIEFEHPITGHWMTAYSPFPRVFRDHLKEQKK